MADMIDHCDAMEQLRMTRAMQLGYLNAENGKDTAVQSHTRALERLAMPKDYSHLDRTPEEDEEELWQILHLPKRLG